MARFGVSLAAVAPSRTARPSSQVVDLAFHLAAALGFHTDREIADLFGVTPENVAHWRAGTVRELKGQTLEAVKEALSARLNALRDAARGAGAGLGMHRVEVEEGSSPTDLQRQFQDRVAYDYLGHRFLYYEPHGALAWENLIRGGYEQASWLAGVARCSEAWLEGDKGGRGPIAAAVAHDKKARARGLDVVSLGPGEGGKEAVFLKALRASELYPRLPWLSFAPVDVSIPLLLSAAQKARAVLESPRQGDVEGAQVLPFCSDFEEGRLSFMTRLPTETRPPNLGVRVVLLLGNTFGNLRDEQGFMRQKLDRLLRPGDLLWLEVALRPAQIEHDSLYPMTLPGRSETSGETNRRILLEGPFRRWEAAMGRPPTELAMRVFIREDDETCHVPGSLNFCHDLVIAAERRACSMLYSRRYDVEALTAWLERQGYAVERLAKVEDSKGTPRVAHLLLRRR